MKNQDNQIKITLISFDYWNYDYHIVKTLQNKGVEATHIDISKFSYQYKNVTEKIKNFFLKTFLKKNIKKIKRQEFILNELKRIGNQDAILIIRPDLIDRETHLKIKSYTKNYTTYLYDSCERFPINHLLSGVFNKVFSYNLKDVKTHDFEHITNYIYLKKQDVKPQFKYDVFVVMSPDERIKPLEDIAKQLDFLGFSYKFIIVGRKKPSHLYHNIEHSKEEIDPLQLKTLLNESKIILDLVRNTTSGLSFRIFEALALQKKIITNNTSVKNYAFYNPNNILVIDNKNLNFKPSFFETNYEPIDPKVYHQFTVAHFTETIFDLN